METLSISQRLALNSICANDFGKDAFDGRAITFGDLIKRQSEPTKPVLEGIKWEDGTLIINDSHPELSALSSMLDWKLIAYQPNKLSGFRGMAFQKPDGEVVFAFGGTEVLGTDFITAAQDVITDAQIAIPAGNAATYTAHIHTFIQKIMSHLPIQQPYLTVQ